MPELLEIIMIITFGACWPINLMQSYKARCTKGKSLAFLVLVLVGYISGITSKLVNANFMSQIAQKWYVLFFYVLNFIMVFADFCMFFRNKKLEKSAQNAE